MYYAEIEEEEDEKANIEMLAAAALEVPTTAETISWPSSSQLATPQENIYDEQ